MKKNIKFFLLIIGIIYASENSLQKIRYVDNLQQSTRSSRSGIYGLVCQNESGSYNPDMLNYLYSPIISIPDGDEVSADFLLKGSFLDPDDFPLSEYWGLQIRTVPGLPNSFSDEGWCYVSNPYADTATVDIDFNEDGVIDSVNDILVGDPYPPNYVYSDAPDIWSLFSTIYSTPIDIDDYAGSSVQFRYWFRSDSDAPQGEGLFLDDFTVNVDGTNTYFESFEDSTMAGWVSVDQTSTEPAWHIDSYGAYGGSGNSWWMGDPEIGNNGGYLDHWYQVLDTPPIDLPNSTIEHTITFDQKRAIENLCSSPSCPGCPDNSSATLYDGWDAFNVRISSDGGVNWEILNDVSPSYNSSDTYSFGFEFGEGCGIPGWGGPESANPIWEPTTINIPTSYNGQEIIIRFAFSADPGYCTLDNNNLTGVWIDNINVANVFFNDAEDDEGFDAKSLVPLGGDLWHVDFIGSPPVVPVPENVTVLASDGVVEVAWDAPAGNVYDDEWVSFNDGTFENAIVIDGDGQSYLGTGFDMAYGLDRAIVHSVRVHASGAGTTTLGGFALINGEPGPTPLFTQSISTVENNYSEEIELNWEFQSSFIIAMMVTSDIGLSIDENGTGSNSWSNLGGWSPWPEVAGSSTSISNGEFGIQAKITSVGGSIPRYNVYRNPGLDGSVYQLMFNGTGISSNSYTDNIVSNGVEYCYKIASVYDEEISDKVGPVCGEPISDTVYEIAYDDNTHEDGIVIGNNNYIASKFTPDAYPSSLFSASIFISSNSQVGNVLFYVWDDNGDDGIPGNAILQGLLVTLIPGWNEINLSNLGLDFTIEDGSVYIGYQQLNINFQVGVDWDNPSYSPNCILDYGTGTGWESLNTYSTGGVFMIRAQIDGENALSTEDKSIHIPYDFVLDQNFPNPFNPVTNIRFGLSEQSMTTLVIYNILGKNVRTIVNESLNAGFYNYKISMDGLPSGMYFYKLTATGEVNSRDKFDEVKKMILIR